ncbi:TerD family protein [Fodinicola acaciae]|uniref:TerD family protein n=1 Tax=Fodinicola acaciae TaxID=2681555 RepID=UPI0013D5227D|nr:TerD family protein [Fodinicola acaciae]
MLISKGQNVPVNTAAVRVVVGWKDTEFAPSVQVCALLLCPNRVRTDDDFVTPDNKVHRSGTVRFTGDTTIDGVRSGNLLVALAGMDPPVQRIAVVGSAVGGYFGQLSDLHIQIMSATGGEEIARFDTRETGRERVFVMGELYRRDGGWKFRAVGQGYRSGLAGLANDFGLTPPIDDTAPPEPSLPSKPAKPAERKKRPAPQPPPQQHGYPQPDGRPPYPPGQPPHQPPLQPWPPQRPYAQPGRPAGPYQGPPPGMPPGMPPGPARRQPPPPPGYRHPPRPPGGR